MKKIFLSKKGCFAYYFILFSIGFFFIFYSPSETTRSLWKLIVAALVCATLVTYLQPHIDRLLRLSDKEK